MNLRQIKKLKVGDRICLYLSGNPLFGEVKKLHPDSIVIKMENSKKYLFLELSSYNVLFGSISKAEPKFNGIMVWRSFKTGAITGVKNFKDGKEIPLPKDFDRRKLK